MNDATSRPPLCLLSEFVRLRWSTRTYDSRTRNNEALWLLFTFVIFNSSSPHQLELRTSRTRTTHGRFFWESKKCVDRVVSIDTLGVIFNSSSPHELEQNTAVFLDIHSIDTSLSTHQVGIFCHSTETFFGFHTNPDYTRLFCLESQKRVERVVSIDTSGKYFWPSHEDTLEISSNVLRHVARV